jgi:hypothetical protein
MTDDDDLHDFDLSAWDAPPPPAGLADAVLARMHAAAPVAAVEEPRSARRWWIGGAAVAAVAAGVIGTVIALGHSHRPAAGHGDVVAVRAQRLELDTVDAELDTGADLTWQRDRDGVHVEQRHGNATWRVVDDQLQVAAAGAAIDATGASLRVEVHMNLSDARVLGASTVTAAAVAFVTVVVYEGHVKVTSSGQTVNVEPGGTVEVHPGQPPAPPALVGGTTDDEIRRLRQRVDELESVGKPGAGLAIPTATDQDSSAMADRLRPQIAACGDKLHATGTYTIAFTVRAVGTLDPAADFSVDMDDAVANDFDALTACMKDAIIHTSFPAHALRYQLAFPLSTASETLERDAISQGMSAARGNVAACGQAHPAHGVVKVHVRVRPDGTVAEAAIESTPNDALGRCLVEKLATVKFAATSRGLEFSYPFKFTGVTVTGVSCDLNALDEKARQEEAVGLHANALASFEAALRCRPTQRDYELAFMAACNAGNRAKAKELAQMCVRNGITPAMLADADVGFLEIGSRPPAMILIDGKDTGHVTPIHGDALKLAPGQHRLTLTVGKDRYTFPVTIETGKTTRLTKDLQ